MSPSPEPGKRPNIWALASVTYGLVVFTTLIAIGGYWYMRSRMPGARQAEVQHPATVAVGSVWVPLYPDTAVTEYGSVQRENALETVARFRSKAAGPVLVSFYQGRLSRGVFRLDRVKRDEAGGIVQATTRNGKTTVTVRVEGSSGEITALDRPDP